VELGKRIMRFSDSYGSQQNHILVEVEKALWEVVEWEILEEDWEGEGQGSLQ
jgi:hypothetical protein